MVVNGPFQGDHCFIPLLRHSPLLVMVAIGCWKLTSFLTSDPSQGNPRADFLTT